MGRKQQLNRPMGIVLATWKSGCIAEDRTKDVPVGETEFRKVSAPWKVEIVLKKKKVGF